jgi:hypothetical protein
MPEAPSAASAVGKVFAPELSIAPLRVCNANHRINQFLIDHIPPAAWKGKTPHGKGRTIPAIIAPAIIAHMHNVGVMGRKARAQGNQIPALLDRTKVTRSQALHARERSRRALSVVMITALPSDRRIRGFRPHVARFTANLIAHDAHHRGPSAMQARPFGHPLPQKAMFGMGEWGQR